MNYESWREIVAKTGEVARKIMLAGGRVYLVGGSVRDLELEAPINDIDLATNLKSYELLKIFQGKHVCMVGKSFGVVKIDNVDIATFRKDIYYSKIHTKGADKVEYAQTIEEDLGRRDFTINAMAREFCFNLSTELLYSGELIDPFNGKQDLKDKIIRFVGEPNTRIDEDPCRLLRALRFASILGFQIEEKSLKAIKENKPKFLRITNERIRLEILKTMMQAKKPSIFISKLYDVDLLFFVFPSLIRCRRVGQGKHHAEDVFEHCLYSCDAVSRKYPLIRLAALLHDCGKPQSKTSTFINSSMEEEVHFYGHETYGSGVAAKELKFLKFSNKEVEYVSSLVRKHMFFFSLESKESTYKRLMSSLDYPIRDLLRLRLGDRKGNLSKKGIPSMFKHVLKIIRKIEKEKQVFSLKDLKINGTDLILMGFKQGPDIGVILKECFEYAIKFPEKNTKIDLESHVVFMYGKYGMEPKIRETFKIPEFENLIDAMEFGEKKMTAQICKEFADEIEKITLQINKLKEQNIKENEKIITLLSLQKLYLGESMSSYYDYVDSHCGL